MIPTAASTATTPLHEPRLTSLSHGGGCGCKIAPGVLAEILKGTAGMPIPKELLVGIETADDAAVYQLNDEQAIIATTDFFTPIGLPSTSLSPGRASALRFTRFGWIRPSATRP